MSALTEAVAEFERWFSSVSDDIGFPAGAEKRDWSRAPTGDMYVTLMSGGIKAEGEMVPASFASEDGAIAAWLFSAREYAAKLGDHLYWRIRPELREDHHHRAARFVVYSRMFVGSAPAREWAAARAACIIPGGTVSAERYDRLARAEAALADAVKELR